MLWTINAGGVSGLVSCLFSMPQDIIKSKQQTHFGREPLRMKDAFLQLHREGGIKRIFKGTTPTLARGYLANMVTLPLFDYIHNKLTESDSDS